MSLFFHLDLRYVTFKAMGVLWSLLIPCFADDEPREEAIYLANAVRDNKLVTGIGG
jgi:hypothetical protein